MGRIQYAIETVAHLASEYPVRFTLWIVALDAAATGGAYWLSFEVGKDRGLIVAGAVVVGALTAVAILFLWALVTAPRRDLQIRVGAIEDAIEAIRGQLGMLTEEKFGEPLMFLPIYETLRSDIRQALRTFSRAQATGELWARTDVPEYDEWKKQKEAIATNPWAQVDNIHGELVEAFDHVERLARVTTMRFGRRRRVRSSDDFEAAVTALEAADRALTGAIDRLSAIREGRVE